MKNSVRVAFLGLYFIVCATWYIGQMPVEMTPEQETMIVAGAAEISSDCLGASGGCIRKTLNDDDEIWLLAWCSPLTGNYCEVVLEWSDDDTGNQTCQNVTYSFWNWACGVSPDHICQMTYNYCQALRCNGTATKDGTGTATQCYW